ncbi:unnamed protein product [Rotaria sp. Silwood1]|nr:unnamed protein product [Rotaria sp. Silwood1]CAF1682253.1 unnamed protein product [Rotaria sp. Silwood1]CAF3870107.1 unnamed protein product [Rotaria sp. Silwood1]CAF5013316.1 unnamed protein product [Rotaria sp. Silwood1]
MNVNESDEKMNTSNNDQITPLLPITFNVARELNCLRTIDSLYVKQRHSAREIILDIPSSAKFDIYSNNVRILQALETSSLLQRLSFGPRRSVTLRIIDNNNQVVILMKRESKCGGGCCWFANVECCSEKMMVESPPGTFIGYVSQEKSYCRPMFAIKDSNDNHIFTVRGPLGLCDEGLSCRYENKYRLIGTDRITEVGFIEKRHRGFLTETFTSADAYFLKIPMDLDLKMKALSLAALFLIEYMFYSTVSPS